MIYIRNLDQSTLTDTLPTVIGATGGLHPVRDWQTFHAAGWRKVENIPQPADGEQIVSMRFEQDADPDYARAIIETEPIPTPEPYPTPHTTVPLLDADGNQIGTASLYVYADSMQTVASINSASPVRPASVQLDEYRRTVKALNAAKAEIDKLKADLGKVQSESAQLKADVDKIKKAGGK